MLFPYTYVHHSIENMQEHIDFIFYQVWCEAPWQKYDISLFDGKPDLREIIEDLHNTEPKGAEFFIRGIQNIFEEFSPLNTLDIQRLQYWYLANNSIGKICQKADNLLPIRYDKLETCFHGRYESLSKQLHSFYKNLYSDSFLSLKVISSKIGTIDNHHAKFSRVNNQGKCPFCCIKDIKGFYHIRPQFPTR